MESNSDQYSWTPQLRLILHVICLFGISQWECIGWMCKEAYLDFIARKIIVHLHHPMAQSLHAPWAALYSRDDTPESSIPSLSWCLVCSSDHAGLSFEPLQRPGGDHSLYYHHHWVHGSVAMSVELCIAPVRLPVQMPGTARSIPRTSELLTHGLQLWDSGLSHPLWV